MPRCCSSARTGAADATRGPVLGGDDYVRKPFVLEELVARVRALLRRARGDQERPTVLRAADVVVNLDRYQASRAGVVVDLTPTELRLLETLVRNAGRILTRAQILDAVWDDPGERDPAPVETVVSRVATQARGPRTTTGGDPPGRGLRPDRTRPLTCRSVAG